MSENIKHIFTIYTDGSCPNNNSEGPGGWGAIFLEGLEDSNNPWSFDSERVVKVISGGTPVTTNNRMELSAIIEALKELDNFTEDTNNPIRCRVEVVSDSQYCVNGCSKWVTGWEKKGWVTRDKQPVKNQDLWKDVLELMKKHEVTLRWCKGHNGNPHNELADKVAGHAVPLMGLSELD